MSDKIKFPRGLASIIALAAAASMLPTEEIWNNETTINIGELSADGAIDVTPHAELSKNANLNIRWSTAGSQTLTFDTDHFEAPAKQGSAGKKYVQSFYFDGTKFIAKAAAIQLN
jgi:hypothetical protein